MKIEINNNAVSAIVALALAAIFIAFILAGCHTDNRIRTKPVLDYEIPPAQKEIYRLHFMREMWAQRVLRDYEKSATTHFEK